MEEKSNIWIVRKFGIYLLKVIPMFLALMAILNTILSYFDIDAPILSYIGGVSLSLIILLYLLSYSFRFCEYHRIFIHYVTLNWIINIYDYYVGLPMSNKGVYMLYFILIGILFFLALYYHQKARKEGKLKNIFV